MSGRRNECPRAFIVSFLLVASLYMHVQMQVDDRSGNFTTFEFEPQRNKLWIC